MMRAGKFAITVSLVSVMTLSAGCLTASAQINWGGLPNVADTTARLQQIDQDLTFGPKQGRLTQEAADSFRIDLNRIKQMDTQFRADGKFNIWERTRLVFELDNLQKQIDASLAPRNSALSDIPARLINIGGEISDGLFTGRLTRQEADQLRAELDQIRAKQTQFMADGALNPSETLTLSLEIDSVQKTVHSALRPLVISDPAVNAKKLEIIKRLADLQARSRITPGEAEALKQELARIEAKQRAFEASGAKLDTNESLTLAIELERLDAELDRFQPGGGVEAGGINARQQRVENLISDALHTGRLTSQEVLELKSEFDRIKALEMSFRADGVLSDSERQSLTHDLETLENRVQRLATNFPPGDDVGSGIGGLTTRFDRLRKRLSNAQANGRLSATVSQELQAQLDRLEDRWHYLEVDGRLSASETLTLANDLDQLKIRMDNAIAGAPKPDPTTAVLDRQIREKKDAFGVKLSAAMSADKLTSSLSAKLQRDFDRIKEAEEQFRKSDNSLSEWEVTTLSRDLDKLDADLGSAIASAATPPPTTKPPIDTSNVAPDTRGHWAEQYVALLSKKGTIGGFPDGTFKPNDQITRAQFAAIASRALNLPAAGRPADFKDVPQKYWASSVISQVSDAGLVTGFPDGTFRPEDKITRAQALVILAKALQNAGGEGDAISRYIDNSSVPTWARPSVSKAANAGIIVNHPDPKSIRPNDLATRAEIAALTYQTMSKLGESLPQIRVGLEAN